MKMLKTIFLIFVLFLQTTSAYSQYSKHKWDQYPEKWNSEWITHPEIDKTAYGLIHFRNTFELTEKPDRFIIHVSGDNRYRLYANGKEVCYGPQMGDIRHWRYETVDLAPFLEAGKNTLAAEVMNWGVERSYGILSFKTGFLVQGNSAAENIVNTDYNCNWKVFKNRAMNGKKVQWMNGKDIIGGFYAGNPTDSVVAADYPWNWQEPAFDDSRWLVPEVIFARPKTNAGAGHGWILQARTTPIQSNKKEAIGKVVRTNMPDLNNGFRFGQEEVVVPANSSATILIDKGLVTLGYPKLKLSKGKNAIVRVKYSEALYDANNQKGNRNQIEGKRIAGISDVYVMDGGESRTFQPMWRRTFRFVELQAETHDEALVIEDFYNIYSAAKVPVAAAFETENSLYQKVWDLCWHTMEVCAQDNLMSDAYYEQMQYVGDLRPHLMGWTALTGDLDYFTSAIQQFNNSRLPDGNITSCYPLKATFVHPTYSLVWIDMLHDLMMLQGDKSEIEQYNGEIQEVFDYYETLINENGLVGKSEYHMFVDWYVPKGGNSKVNKEGNSAILTLNYAHSLKNAAEIMNWLGYRKIAEQYKNRSRKYAEITRKLCFDPDKGIYADDPEKTFYDQRASVLAVLCGAHSQAEKVKLMQQVLDEQTIFDSRANLFYYFYLFKAMQKTKVGDFTKEIEPWQKMLELGMSGTPEKRVEQNPRSEIHPWTAHPVHFYFSLVAGIQPTCAGFKTVRIAPQPGSLKTVRGKMPTVRGIIQFDMVFKNDECSGDITLPENMSGTFVWGENETPLKAGINKIEDS